MSLERLTVVVPTFNRHEYVYRLINFWSNTQVRILVLDGSPEPHFDFDCLQRDNFFYHHSPVSIEKRIGDSIAFVDTDYVVLMSDDEFYLPSTCCDCIEFLDQHLDFSACKGQAVGFGWTGQFVYGKQAYPMLFGYGINSDNPGLRMFQHMAPYQMASLWAVQRKDVYVTCAKVISNGESFSSAAAAEIQISLVTAFLGKIKVLDDLMWFRSNENKNIWWESGNVSFASWWRDKAKKSEHERFYHSIRLFSHDEKGVKPTFKELNAAIENYISSMDSKRKNTKLVNHLKKNLINLLNDKRYKSAKKIVFMLLKICHLRPRHVPLNSYIAENFVNKLAEAKLISEIVKVFHAK